MRSIAATVLSLIATVLGMLVLVLAWVLTTETGLKFTLQQIHGLMPERFAVGAIEGRLTGPLTIRDLRLETETSLLTAEYVNFDWSPSRLFVGDVVIDRLHVRNAILTSYGTAPAQPEEPGSTPAELLAQVQSLPAIELHDIALQHFEYRAPGSKPFVIQHAELAAGIDARGVHIDKLRAHGPLFAIRGRAIIEPQGGHPTRGELHWQMRLPDYPTAVGHITLSGSLQELHVEQRIEAPYSTRASVVLNELLTEPHFQAEVQVNTIELQAIGAELPSLTLSATAHAKGRASDIEYTARATVIDPAQGTFKLMLDGGLQRQIIAIRRLALKVVGTPARLQANGQVDLSAKQPELDLQGDWQALRWPLQGEPRFTSPRGTVKLTGTPQDLTARLDAAVGDDGGISARVRREQDKIDLALDWHDLNWPLQHPRVSSPEGTARVAGTLKRYTVAVTARVDTPKQVGGHIILGGTGSNKSLDLSRIDLKVLEGEINGRASVTWQPQLEGQINLSGRGINPGVLLPEWPGRLSLRLQASAASRANTLVAQLSTLSISGRLRDQDFALNARAEYRGDQLQLERLSLTSGSSTVRASGKIGPELGFNWRIDSDNLATLWPGATGSLHGEGLLSGTLRQPRIKATLTGDEVRYALYEVAQLALQADIDMQGKVQSSVELRLQDAQAADLELSKIHFAGHGTPRAHQFDLTTNTSTGAAELHLNGGLQESIWSFELTEARLKYPTLPAWTLAEPAQGHVSADTQQLERTCWASGPARLCLRGQKSAEGLQGAFQLDGLPFDYFAALMPPSMQLRGKLSGHGTVRQPSGGVLIADVQLNTTAGGIFTTTAGDETPAPILRFKPAELQADLGTRGLDLSLSLPLVDQGGLHMNAEIPAGAAPLTARPLSAQVRVEIRDIGFLAKLMPDIKEMGGRLQGLMQISGTLARPALLGRLALLNGSARLPGPNLHLTDLSVEIVGQRTGGLRYSVHAKSGGGTLRIAGTADWTGEAPSTALRITGHEFQAFNTAEAEVFISPDLHVALDATDITVTGEVRIPRARITPEKIPASAVTVSEDQIIIRPHENEAGAVEGRKLHVKVLLILGEHVRFEGFGLKGRIDGRLLIVQQPGGPTTGSGELRIVNGEYRAYGQGLVIETGRILFAGGPIDQPGVNIRAVRHPAEDITVGVQVRGSLKKPEFT
ncbi:MAG: translocation/assembly module TamB domain-containing protein, partial [Nitrococcus sp.]|nr:translocation/assembly module TamB domain-containing protein [Nitrococcus sp.]